MPIPKPFCSLSFLPSLSLRAKISILGRLSMSELFRGCRPFGRASLDLARNRPPFPTLPLLLNDMMTDGGVDFEFVRVQGELPVDIDGVARS